LLGSFGSHWVSMSANLNRILLDSLVAHREINIPKFSCALN
jgi:hypothetical protein